jgi:hypothetical protein
VIVNGEAGLRPSLAAIDWSFVLDALDYGPPLGSACGWAYLQVGAPCTLVIRTHARLPVSLTGVRVGCGPPRTRWLTSVVPAPGRVDGG